MKRNAFGRGATVKVPGHKVTGTVAGCAQYLRSESSYLLKWINPDGSHSDSWFGESVLREAQRRVRSKAKTRRKAK